jgi:ferric-dicitrate binding protein FerR (iron transport regulator)
VTSPPRNGERDVEDVLRNAGRRSEPPDDVVQSVRAAVEVQWREVVERRARRRRIGLSLAAGVAFVAVGLWAARPWLPGATDERMASISVATGSVQVKSGWLSRWQPVGLRQALHAGEQVETASSGRVALTLGDGLSVRLDHDTLISLVDSRHISLSRGALYVDSGSKRLPTGSELQIVTPAGAVRHLGTQYETRVVGSQVQITVREGKVELDTGAGSTHRASAGEQIVVSSAGSVQRSAVSPYDARWEWVSATAPSFDIDGRSVGDFLTWVARELGCEVVYADSQTQAEASRVLLSGSISGLNPGDALAAVMPTTPLRGEVRSGQLLVSLSGSGSR